MSELEFERKLRQIASGGDVRRRAEGEQARRSAMREQLLSRAWLLEKTTETVTSAHTAFAADHDPLDLTLPGRHLTAHQIAKWQADWCAEEGSSIDRSQRTDPRLSHYVDANPFFALLELSARVRHVLRSGHSVSNAELWTRVQVPVIDGLLPKIRAALPSDFPYDLRELAHLRNPTRAEKVAKRQLYAAVAAVVGGGECTRAQVEAELSVNPVWVTKALARGRGNTVT